MKPSEFHSTKLHQYIRTIDVELTKFQNGELIWKSSPHFLKENGIADESFIDSYSYLKQGTPLFETLNFVSDDKTYGKAEVYSSGLNAGGARVVNLDNSIQLKGVGLNSLANKHTDLWHANGGFSIIESVLETINAEVLSYVLPLGTVKVFGLIKVGRETSYLPCGNEDWSLGPGVIMVRERCVRPSHFLDIKNFISIDSEFNYNSVTRESTEEIYTALADREGANEFFNILATFLTSNARQFAQAKVFGIYHAAINKSNITFGGSWLDLTTASFVEQGQNYSQSEKLPDFFSEHCTILNSLRSLVEEYNQINGENINFDELTDIYVKEFSDNLIKSVFSYLGDDGRVSDSCSSEFLSQFSFLPKFIFRNKSALTHLPEGNDIRLIDNCFIRAFAANGDEELKFLIHSVAKKLSSINNVNTNTTKKFIFFSLLKRNIFSSLFYRENIRHEIHKLLVAEDYGSFDKLIDLYGSASKEVHSNAFNKRLVLVSFEERLTISVNIEEDTLSFFTKKEITIPFKSALPFIAAMPTKLFSFLGLNYKNLLIEGVKLLNKVSFED